MLEHGQRSRYTQGCRCDRCTEAQRAYMDGYRLRLVEREPLPGAHGKVSTYNNWSCRCDECTAAKAEDNRRLYAARKEQANA